MFSTEDVAVEYRVLIKEDVRRVVELDVDVRVGVRCNMVFGKHGDIRTTYRIDVKCNSGETQ